MNRGGAQTIRICNIGNCVKISSYGGLYNASFYHDVRSKKCQLELGSSSNFNGHDNAAKPPQPVPPVPKSTKEGRFGGPNTADQAVDNYSERVVDCVQNPILRMNDCGAGEAVAEKKAGRKIRSRKRLYCASSCCLNRHLHNLHREALSGVEGANIEIDRYMLPCAILLGFQCAAVSEEMLRSSAGNNRVAQLGITCICGDAAHTFFVQKPAYCVQFSVHQPAYLGVISNNRVHVPGTQTASSPGRTVPAGGASSLVRDGAGKASTAAVSTQEAGLEVRVVCSAGVSEVNSGDGGGSSQRRVWRKRPALPRPLSVSIESLVPCVSDTVQYLGLPDLGGLISSLLLRRYHTTSRSVRAVQGGFEEEAGCGDWGGGGAATSTSACGGGVNNNTTTVCSVMLQDSIPGLKRNKRTQQSVLTGILEPSRMDCTVCLRVMLATLLKLYSRGAKRPIFSARVTILRRLMDLMSMDTAGMFAFIVEHESLVKICFMEYCLNFITDFMPSEYRIIFDGSKQMDTYRSACVTTCDTFRVEALVTGAEAWKEIDALACSHIDRCLRVCKFKMVRITPLVTRVSLQSSLFNASMLDRRFMYGDIASLRTMYPNESHAFNTMTSVFQNNVLCNLVPQNVRCMQQLSLHALYSSCCQRKKCAGLFYFCITCAVSGKGVANTKMRSCSRTGQLDCVTCPRGSVLCVNMVGVMLTICSTRYYMCPCCTRVRTWTGQGVDMCPNFMALPQQHPYRVNLHSRYTDIFTTETCKCGTLTTVRTDAVTTGTLRPPFCKKVVCMMCGVLHQPKMFIQVPNIQRRCIVVAHFCYKHNIPQHVLRNITNSVELEKNIHEYFSNRSGSRKLARK